LAIHFLSISVLVWRPNGRLQTALSYWVYGSSGLLFFLGTQLYAQRKAWTKSIVTMTLVFALWSSMVLMGLSKAMVIIPFIIPLVGVAVLFCIEGNRRETLTDWLLALSFATWILIDLVTALLQARYAVEASQARPVVIVPLVSIAILMVMALYEEEKRRVERSMLALANINLATSSYVGSKIQPMLSQTLDRILSVVHVPAGAIFLRLGDEQSKISHVATGLTEKFFSALQKENLDDYLIDVVAGLGGLLGFRDLQSDSPVGIGEESKMSCFRELALTQGLRSIVGVSLQAREQAFGVLVLGSPDNRRFTPEVLRLLLALGHQVGMALENSHLIQQTSRRSEELHVLNEIGRVLSSTLNKEDLMRKVWEELRRLFEVDNFYIAELDPLRDELNFGLEINHGTRMPKRTRGAGNHLTEYLMRTRQPVLIRENYAEEVRKLGVEPLRTRGSFCGVPLVAYDHAIGAMAVYSDQERAFDEGHLELLRILASEASIAIENARLIHEERTKARYLALLNSISRNAIATLNPDDMLAKIVEQLEAGLSYDHIGIGVLDYSTREIVIQAEAGKHRGALGERIALGTGLIGQVARSGHMAVYRSAVASESNLKPILAASVAAIALPVFYAEQLHGILYAESTQPTDFSEEEILLLRTLADLIADALHHVLSFQKVQEQAIVDGLTGVKTHRFFMDALHAAFRDSKKTLNPFTVIMIDLDKFKLVNDTMGHLEGDAVLERVANLLHRISPARSTVARYGGDEFIVLLESSDANFGMKFAEDLRAEFLKDTLLSKRMVTASIGVAEFPSHGSNAVGLLEAADKSMYVSKRAGGNKASMCELSR